MSDGGVQVEYDVVGLVVSRLRVGGDLVRALRGESVVVRHKGYVEVIVPRFNIVFVVDDEGFVGVRPWCQVVGGL